MIEVTLPLLSVEVTFNAITKMKGGRIKFSDVPELAFDMGVPFSCFYRDQRFS